MQIVIDIPTTAYEAIEACKGIDKDNNGNIENVLILAVENGTPLPKGHGRLIDADDLIQELSVVSSRPIKSQLYIFRDAPTIIEADKAESEEV